MYAYYPQTDCGTAGIIPTYTCNPCPKREFGRVRSVAWLKVSSPFLNPSSSSEWAEKIASKDVIVIWETSGDYDGGSTNELPGFGDTETVNGGTTHVLTYNDPNYSENCDFYNSIKFSSEYTLIYRTSSQIHIIGSPVTATPKNPVSNDLKSYVTWVVQCKWTNELSPCSWPTPEGIFDRCYVVTD